MGDSNESFKHIEQALHDITKAVEGIQQQLNHFQLVVENLMGKRMETPLVNDTSELKERLSYGYEGRDQVPLAAGLFKMITNVYVDEEVMRINTHRQKKSSRRVSVNLGSTLEEFFAEQFEDLEVRIERDKKDGLLIFYINDTPRAAFKYMNDLGYFRGEKWYGVIEDLVLACMQRYGLGNDNLFILVGSMLNSVDKDHVEKTLDRSISSNTEFLHDHNLVAMYLEKYVAGLTALDEPDSQVYFLAAEMHPNVVATELLNREEERDTVMHQIDEYNWFCSVEELVHSVRYVLTK